MFSNQSGRIQARNDLDNPPLFVPSQTDKIELVRCNQLVGGE